jgi:hypothetical protein
MKLKQNQMGLIYHLAQFQTLDYPSCLRLLDEENTGDRTALSYAFRPLTKHKYLRKHKDGQVTLLAKGREQFLGFEPYVTIGGGETCRKRVNFISRTGMFMILAGVAADDSPCELTHCHYFIPSTCWRKIQKGITSTAKFTGILFVGEHRLAVYDIGDGSMDWQLRAERSLFKVDSTKNYATGMLLICDDDKRIEVAQRIIRQTMWSRKQLIDKRHVKAADKPVAYSRSPIKVASQYGHVYLTTPSLLREWLDEVEEEQKYISLRKGDNSSCYSKKEGDYEEKGWRHFINIATDLLKYVYFFSQVKSGIEVRERSQCSERLVKYSLTLPRSDFPIVRMYPDVLNSEVVQFYEYKPQNDA